VIATNLKTLDIKLGNDEKKEGFDPSALQTFSVDYGLEIS
jgi:hypothetical protein